MFNLPASMGLTDILSLAIAAILVNNYILVQFLGCCSFFGVSKKTDTALGMGMAISKSAEGISRQPEAEGKIRTTLMLGLVFIETAIIYALLVVILIIFVL